MTGYIRDQQRAERPDREPTIDELLRDYMGIDPSAPEAIALPPAAPSQTTVIPETRRSGVIRPVDLPPSRRKASDPN